VSGFYRVAWNADMASDENSVCLSNACMWQNGRKICPDFYTVRKIIQPNFLKRRMVGGGGDLFYLKFCVNWPPLERNRWFSTDICS